MISREEIAHATHRAERNGPDADQTYRDDAGVTWYRFAVDWQCDGRTFSTHIWATSPDDAERRLAALRSNAVVAGQTYSERNVA